jgi:hypothetical protein
MHNYHHRVTALGIDFEVNYDYYPARRGYREPGEPPLEPDELEMIEFNRITTDASLLRVYTAFPTEELLLMALETVILEDL